MMELTPDLIWAAATDAGNRSMRAAGRKVWNEEDVTAAMTEFYRLAAATDKPYAADGGARSGGSTARH